MIRALQMSPDLNDFMLPLCVQTGRYPPQRKSFLPLRISDSACACFSSAVISSSKLLDS